MLTLWQAGMAIPAEPSITFAVKREVLLRTRSEFCP